MGDVFFFVEEVGWSECKLKINTRAMSKHFDFNCATLVLAQFKTETIFYSQPTSAISQFTNQLTSSQPEHRSSKPCVLK